MPYREDNEFSNQQSNLCVTYLPEFKGETSTLSRDFGFIKNTQCGSKPLALEMANACMTQ
jgi:hypothetical protein